MISECLRKESLPPVASRHSMNLNLKGALIKAAVRNSAIPVQQSVQNPCGHPANKPHPAIPAKAGIHRIKRALRAPFKAGAHRPSLQCARTAQYRARNALLRGSPRTFPVHMRRLDAPHGCRRRLLCPLPSFFTARMPAGGCGSDAGDAGIGRRMRGMARKMLPQIVGGVLRGPERRRHFTAFYRCLLPTAEEEPHVSGDQETHRRTQR